ncbi:hypothetical protein DV515_00010830 [Chloebia gouldiae]|uniref:Uncharacterized protein n=1 Tax=Chloebia gouldiae TaxID=44316 RepID=A0A3L8S937_CHLGU|nr:hypothetical protein DV515_00010830 [Chloebia gouldiae]
MAGPGPNGTARPARSARPRARARPPGPAGRRGQATGAGGGGRLSAAHAAVAVAARCRSHQSSACPPHAAGQPGWSVSICYPRAERSVQSQGLVPGRTPTPPPTPFLPHPKPNLRFCLTSGFSMWHYLGTSTGQTEPFSFAVLGKLGANQWGKGVQRDHYP